MIGSAEIVYSLLSNASDVTDLVTDANSGTYKIYTDHAPQNIDLPFIVTFTIDSIPVQSHDGFSGVFEDRMQIDCYSEMPDDSRTLADKVRLALDTKPRTLVAGHELQCILLQGFNSTAFDDADADENVINRCSADYKIWYNAAKPSHS